MIHYHGTPITPVDAAIRVLRGRHAFISYAAPETLPIAAEHCQSFALDNGAFSVWRKGNKPDWEGYYDFVFEWMRRPNFDFAIIPDVIDGDESANNALVRQWPFDKEVGVPVWHLHESLSRLRSLMGDWPRIALGSSGQYQTPNTQQWWLRMQQVMDAVCDADGYPRTKLHGLRMLHRDIISAVPLSSADSTNVTQNCGLAWRGRYEPASKGTKAIVIAERIESVEAATCWQGWTQRQLIA